MIPTRLHQRFYQTLLSQGFIDEPRCAELCAAETTNPVQQLLASQELDEQQLTQALAQLFALQYVDLQEHTIDSALYDYLPIQRAHELAAVPYHWDGSCLDVVVADPYDLSLPARIEQVVGKPVRLLLSTRSSIQAVLGQSQSSSHLLQNLSTNFHAGDKPGHGRQNKSITLDESESNDGPLIRLINTILSDALKKRASDIHLEAHTSGTIIKYRTDGVLYAATETLDGAHHGALVSRLKVMAELDIAEKRIPQDGRFSIQLAGHTVDCRVSILPSVFAEDVVIRLLDQSSVTCGKDSLSLSRLGFDPETVKKFRKAVHVPYGMILITGPTGSGKTTTLYSALTELNSGLEKIITIEDPVEYQLEGIVQIPVNEKKDLTFARGLRSILRHDPDKIMVGEIRDLQTAQIAVQSALTGHLVFTTVHANNAVDVMGRFSHMGVDVYSFVSALSCVMAQRLVRLLCEQCKQQQTVSAEMLESSGLDVKKYKTKKFYQPQGCKACDGKGYYGRTAITELLNLSAKIRDLIIARASASEIQKTAVLEGMQTLRSNAMQKVMNGETTLEEINRVTFVE